MREQSKWREIEKCGWKCFALVYVGWMTGQESPRPPLQVWLPSPSILSPWLLLGSLRYWVAIAVWIPGNRETELCYYRDMQNKPETSVSCKQHFPFLQKLATRSLLFSQYLFLLSVSFSDCHFSLHKCKCFRCFLGTGSGCPFLLYSVNLLWVPLMCSLQPGPFPEFQPFLSHSNSPFGNSVGISNRFGQNETLTSISSLVRISVNDIMKWLMQNLGVISKTLLSSLTVHHQIL